VRLYELTPDPLAPTLVTHDEPISCFNVSRNTGRIALAGQKQTVHVWDGNTGTKLGSGTRPDAGNPYHLTISGDGRLIATSLRDEGLVFFWDGANGSPIGEPLRVNESFGAYEDVVAANLSPNGKQLAIGGDSGKIMIWDTELRKPIGEPFDAGSRMWNFLVFSEDGRYLVASCDNGTAPAWDLTTRTRLGPDIHHQGPVLWCGITPNAKSILTASADYTIRQWDPRTGAPTGPTLQVKSQPMAGFSPDGQFLLANDTESDVRLWDAATGKQLGRSFVLPSWTRDMMFGPDARWFVAACSDNIGRIWQTPTPVVGTPEQIRLWLEVITGLELTPEGTTRFLNVAEWQERRERLKSLGGEPIELAPPR
jgi:WD40 repeat protein